MRVEKNLFIKDLAEGRDVTIPLFVASATLGQTRTGSPYLTLKLVDSSGVIPGKVWDDVERIKPKISPGKVAVFTGQITSYRGDLQLTVRNAFPVDEADCDPEDYQSRSAKSGEAMRRELLTILEGMADPDYRAITLGALNHPKAAGFWTGPAAKMFHHAFAGGLLEHTLSVVKLAEFVGRHYGTLLNRSLLTAGAALHDIGKVWEFSGGPDNDYTTRGRLLSHLVIGPLFLAEAAKELPGFPEEKLLLLQHLLVSHHGKPEMGSCVTPKVLEGIALHFVDNLDGNLTGVSEYLAREAKPETAHSGSEWTSFNRHLQSHFMVTPRSPEDAGPLPGGGPGVSSSHGGPASPGAPGVPAAWPQGKRGGGGWLSGAAEGSREPFASAGSGNATEKSFAPCGLPNFSPSDPEASFSSEPGAFPAETDKLAALAAGGSPRDSGEQGAFRPGGGLEPWHAPAEGPEDLESDSEMALPPDFASLDSQPDVGPSGFPPDSSVDFLLDFDPPDLPADSGPPDLPNDPDWADSLSASSLQGRPGSHVRPVAPVRPVAIEQPGVPVRPAKAEQSGAPARPAEAEQPGAPARPRAVALPAAPVRSTAALHSVPPAGLGRPSRPQAFKASAAPDALKGPKWLKGPKGLSDGKERKEPWEVDEEDEDFVGGAIEGRESSPFPGNDSVQAAGQMAGQEAGQATGQTTVLATGQVAEYPASQATGTEAGQVPRPEARQALRPKAGLENAQTARKTAYQGAGYPSGQIDEGASSAARPHPDHDMPHEALRGDSMLDIPTRLASLPDTHAKLDAFSEAFVPPNALPNEPVPADVHLKDTVPPVAYAEAPVPVDALPDEPAAFIGEDISPPFTGSPVTASPPDTEGLSDTIAPPDTVSPSDTGSPPDTVSPTDTASPSDTAALSDTIAPPDTATPSDAVSSPDSAALFDTIAPPDAVPPPDTAGSPDTASPLDTIAPPDTAFPPDTAAPPDTAFTPETASPPDKAVPPDTAAPSETASPPDRAWLAETGLGIGMKGSAEPAPFEGNPAASEPHAASQAEPHPPQAEPSSPGASSLAARALAAVTDLDPAPLAEGAPAAPQGPSGESAPAEAPVSPGSSEPPAAAEAADDGSREPAGASESQRLKGLF
ncbi:MAG: HD domain-containing protein [Deltaproteobacteria bacterium]|nr:HD domain-containing protein [Deltaproteobacteria bacterium]